MSLSTIDSNRHRYDGEGRVLKVRKVVFDVMKKYKKSTQLYILQGSTVIGMQCYFFGK